MNKPIAIERPEPTLKKTDNRLNKLYRFFRIFHTESKYEIIKTFRQPGFVIPSLAFPMMFYLFFAVIFNRQAMGGMMPTYMLATYATFGVMGPALFSFGVGVAVERNQGWFDLKQASPMPPLVYILARVSLTLVFSLLILCGLYLLAGLFGNVQLEKSQWLLLTLVLLGGTVPFCLIGLWLGLRASANGAPALVNLIYLPLSFLSGLWIPIAMFPELLRNFAQLSPAYHLSQLALQVVESNTEQHFSQQQPLFFHLAVLTGYAILFAVLAAKRYQSELRQ